MRGRKQTVSGTAKPAAGGALVRKPVFRNGKQADLQSSDETAYLNSTPENRAALARSLKEAAAGQTVKVDL